MITLKLDIPPEVEDFFEGLSDEDIQDILLDASDGFGGPGGVFEQHFERGQAAWGEADEDYQERKARKYGAAEKFVKTGAARDAMTNPKSPYRVTKLSKSGGVNQVEIALVRMEGGRNIYSIAQAGGRNHGGPPMRVTDNLPGDAEIIRPYVEESVGKQLRKKGFA